MRSQLGKLVKVIVTLHALHQHVYLCHAAVAKLQRHMVRYAFIYACKQYISLIHTLTWSFQFIRYISSQRPSWITLSLTVAITTGSVRVLGKELLFSTPSNELQGLQSDARGPLCESAIFTVRYTRSAWALPYLRNVKL